jgi:hypothetical protein
VADDQRRAARHQPRSGCEHALGRPGVEPGRRLVQQQHRGVADHRPGDREPLPLPARQHPAALPDPGVVAVGQRADEVVRVGRDRGRDDVALARLGPPPEDVVAHGAVEDQRLLQHRGEVAAQVGQRELTQVDPVEDDPAAVGVVEAQQQLGQGRLAGPASPDDGELLSGAMVKRRSVSDGASIPG